MTSQFNWEDLRFFLALARSGSLSEAAGLLETSASTVSRRVERLERNLQETLFLRRHDGYRLTQVGASTMESAEKIEAQIESFKRGVGAEAEELSGIVRVATPELLAHEIILPALPAFRAANPGILLELLADVRPVPLRKRTADVVIRAVRPRDGDYTIRRIGGLVAALFASPEYLARNGTPREPQDLVRHSLIGWDHELRFLVMSKWMGMLVGENRPWLTTSNMTSQYIACRAGLGLAVLPCPIAKKAGLCRVLPHLPPLQLDLWLLVSTETTPGKRLKRVVGFLSELFTDLTDAE